MPASVLIVDDAAFMRMMLKDILTQGGFSVVGEVASGQQAKDAYLKHKPDLVTMDITMPEMDGIEAVREIKSVDKEAKIVMVSAMGQEKLIVEAMEAGAEDFIVKPFQPVKVVETLNRCLKK